MDKSNEKPDNIFLSSLIAGGAAGLIVDVALFPLDTIKTRLQSDQGFRNAGGLTGVYRGLLPQVVGSIPTAALFFCTYENFKKYTIPRVPEHFIPLIHMVGASLGEVVACSVRVPMEIAKQRRQTNSKVSGSVLLQAWRTEGFIKGWYRGFGSTVIREIPFSFIQFPIYEYLKTIWGYSPVYDDEIATWKVAICGAISGGIAATVTTPLDVVKTRIMLADPYNTRPSDRTFLTVFKRIYNAHGIKGLFAGLTPRVLLITCGGAIFFSSYDVTRKLANSILSWNSR